MGLDPRSVTASNDNREPTDVSQPGRWHGNSVDHVRTAYRRHNRVSPWPEDFDGVATGVKPPLDRRWRIIDETVLKTRERGSRRAPCNVCLNRQKCERYSILMMDDLGHLYLVGRDCARRYFPDGEFNELERIHQAEEARDEAFEYMLRITPQIPAWIAAVKLLEPFEIEMTKAHRMLWRACPNLLARINSALTESGLTVDDVEMRMTLNGSKPRRVRRRVAHFSGRPVLNARCTMHPRLTNAMYVFDRYQSTDDSDLMDNILVGLEDGSLFKARKALQRALQDVAEVRDEIVQHRAFFAPATFDALRTWNNAQGGPQLFSFTANGPTRAITSQGENMFKLRFDTLGQPVPQTP